MTVYPVSIPVKLPPFKHQVEGLRLSLNQKNFALFMEMGTGKTKVVIDEAMYLYQAGQIEAIMIVAPKGVYRNWTEVELPKHLNIPAFTTYWSPLHTKELIDSYRHLFNKTDVRLKIVAINVEALSTERGTDFAGKFITQFKTMMIVDESTTIKNHTAARTKNTIRVGTHAKYKRILSGDPVTRSPMDLFTQCWFLDPKLLGYRSYYAFRARYAVMKEQHLAGNRSFQMVVGYQRLDELQALLKGFSYRVKKEDCLDLPEKTYMTRDVELTEEQVKLYQRLKKEAYAEFEGKLVTAPMVITRLLRLHQLVCGHMREDQGNSFDVPTKRVEQLLEVLEEASGKVVIWATYTRDVEKICEALKQEYGEGSYVSFYGNTTQEERLFAVNAFQNHDKVRFFVGNPAAGRFGITLTASSTVVYFSNSYDLEHRTQSEDRVHRIGQTRPCTYIDLVAKGTVDQRIIEALKSKKRIATDTLGDAWRDWLV